MDASVIVCSYNRAGSLAHTVEAILDQAVSPGLRWELLIVDNNSTDNTREVVLDFQASHTSIPVRYEFQPHQGLSHARNLGIAKAHGELLLFTDDDVRPEPDWVQQIVSAMEAVHCDACGGMILPAWEADPPPWLTELFYGYLALRTDQGPARAITSPKEFPFGANMAFRRTTLERFGMFDTHLGRRGTVLASGEEEELLLRILRSGGSIMYFPQARVHHRIERFRTKKRYFRRWRYDTSYNRSRKYGVPGETRILGIPPYLVGQFLGCLADMLKGKFTLPADKSFSKEMVVWHYLGLMVGAFHNRNDRRSMEQGI